MASSALPTHYREIYNGERHYDFPKPIVGGSSAIARIVAVGEDAVILQRGQLVWMDCVIRARDNPDSLFLTAIQEGMDAGSRKPSSDVWRDGAFAEYMKVPLENCIRLNESRLCRELGHTTRELMYMIYLLVPFGGLRDIRLEPGETIVVCPATGGFGGAGVQVAITMGARVIAMGRNEKELVRLKEHIKKGTPAANIETVKMTGDYETDGAAL
jgi:NADPH:quinone reductase-like Zn-dependent oxidoreductase